MSLLEVYDLTHRFTDKTLYRNAGLQLFKGEHMGIVGQNGAGKSTLIDILTGALIPDSGTVKWQPGLKVGHLDQHAEIRGSDTIRAYLKTAFGELYALESRLNELYAEMAVSGDVDKLEQAAKVQEKLESGDFYHVDSRIDKVAQGLGIQAMGLDRPIRELSGGQRARVILAKLLLEDPDVLLLDEPTNFLDQEHVDWLAGFLTGFDGAFILVSHDYHFLEKVTTCICDIEFESIRKYTGRYSDFVRQKEHLRKDYLRQYHAQQKMIEKTEAYIRKNIAGVNSRIAQGRRKQLERVERLAPPAFIHKPSFFFKEIPLTGEPALSVKGLQIGYNRPLLPGLSFSVGGGEKMGITGFNGIGKSTLLNTLVGRIPAIGGQFRFAESVRIGYFEQELVWEDLETTPIRYIAEHYPRMPEKEIRRSLAQCGLDATLAAQAIGTLSGGEQSKVKMCRLVLSPCNFLILDEPTNHLDAETKEALLAVLTRFKGSVLIVSHEHPFYRGWVDRVMKIEG